VSKISVTDVSAQSITANNPIVSTGSASVKSIKIHFSEYFMDQQQQEQQQAGPKKAGHDCWCAEPVLSLPNITATGKLTQVSTMARFIDGKLDRSCFEVDYEVHWGLLSMCIKPQSHHLHHSGKSDENVEYASSIWQSMRLFAHLFQPQAKFSRATALSCTDMTAGKWPYLHAEARMRLGDGFEVFPKRLNVINSISIRKDHEQQQSVGRSGGHDNGVFKVEDQVTAVQLQTLATQCQVRARINVPSAVLSAYNNDSNFGVVASTAGNGEGGVDGFTMDDSDAEDNVTYNNNGASDDEGGEAFFQQPSMEPPPHVAAGQAINSMVNATGAGVGSLLGWVSLTPRSGSNPSSSPPTAGSRKFAPGVPPAITPSRADDVNEYLNALEQERLQLWERIQLLEAENESLRKKT
jgi:hypothetical protein